MNAECRGSDQSAIHMLLSLLIRESPRLSAAKYPVATAPGSDKSPIRRRPLRMFLMDGVLIVDKGVGLTSHDVVAQLRHVLHERRIGHTGTLDPFATGVLAILVGRATRLAQFLSGLEKEYEAVVRLGYATDTGDLTGTRVETESQAKTTSAETLRKEEIEAAILALTGKINQAPPMYSAKKI